MIRRLKRWQLLVAGVSSFALLGLAWSSWSYQKPEQLDAQQIAALTQRCQNAMLRDTCVVMKGSALDAKQERLFIAGVGEVDAQAYARLRAAGDAMCQEVAAQCKANGGGQACKIVRALYPEVNTSSAAFTTIALK